MVLKIRVAKVREKSLEIEKSMSGKSQGISFSVRGIYKKWKKSGKSIRKMAKSQGKVSETAGKFEMDIYWQPWNTAYVFTGRKLCFSY